MRYTRKISKGVYIYKAKGTSTRAIALIVNKLGKIEDMLEQYKITSMDKLEKVLSKDGGSNE